jgi:hypothetical protein
MKDDFKPFRPEPAFAPVPVSEPAEPPVSTDDSPPEPPFVPPEVAAARDNRVEPKQPGELPKPQPDHKPAPKPTPKGPKKWLHYFNHLNRNQKIILASVTAGLLITASGLAWWFVIRKEPPPPPPPPVVKEEPPAPTIYRSRLTGMSVSKELSELPTTGVMIENSPDARPQSGLQQAGVVFEAIAEGGITRFLTLFQESKPEYIGPVRSVRPYYLDFLKPFDAPIAHAGGSGQALAEIRNQKFKDLEAFQSPNYYQRVSNRYAPHNLYTGRSKLLQLQKVKGWTTSKFTGFERKEKEEPAKTPTAKTIDLAISGFYYNPKFTYDAKTNSYLRHMAGVPHKDEKSGRQINPKVVIALVMSHRYAGVYSVYGASGKGQAFIFQDGAVTKVTWVKPNRSSQFKFIGPNNKAIGLNAGQTWLSLVSSTGAVTYKP